MLLLLLLLLVVVAAGVWGGTVSYRRDPVGVRTYFQAMHHWKKLYAYEFFLRGKKILSYSQTRVLSKRKRHPPVDRSYRVLAPRRYRAGHRLARKQYLIVRSVNLCNMFAECVGGFTQGLNTIYDLQ